MPGLDLRIYVLIEFDLEVEKYTNLLTSYKTNSVTLTIYRSHFYILYIYRERYCLLVVIFPKQATHENQSPSIH